MPIPKVASIPFTDFAWLGDGIDSMTGQVLGTPIIVKDDESGHDIKVTGNEATYNVTIIKTQEDFMKSIGLSIEAEGRYGLFSGGGKFDLNEKAQYHQQSTFVVATCTIRRGVDRINVENIKWTEAAQKLIQSGDKDRFKRIYGDRYVRAIQTGGEFVAIFRITSSNTKTEQTLGASIHAECSGLAGKGSFQSAYNAATNDEHSETEISVITYQRGGEGADEIGFTKDVDAIIKRLENFPTAVKNNGSGYELEIADYILLGADVLVNHQKADAISETLTDCTKLKCQYLARLNEIQFARQNRRFFEELPNDDDLQKYYNEYRRAIGAVQSHAIKVAGEQIEPTLFDPGSINPPLNLTILELRKKDTFKLVSVPNVVNSTVEIAENELLRQNLKIERESYPTRDKTKWGIVDRQEPKGDKEVQTGSTVKIWFGRQEGIFDRPPVKVPIPGI
jgi:hypothetical protein